MKTRAATPRPDRTRAVLATRVAGIAVAVALLVATGLYVDGNHVPGTERVVFRLINGIPSFIYWPVWVLMQLGNLVAVPAFVVVALVLRRYRLAIAAVIVGAGKWYGSRLLKDFFFRERPGSILSEVILRDAPATGQAFVSGHAVIAVGLAVIAHPYLSRRWRAVAWTAAALVCLGRVYVGAHLPLDVVGGAAAGWAIGSVANLMTNAHRAESDSRRGLWPVSRRQKR